MLDLRNNPGGLLDQAIALSDAFIDQGLIVVTKGRNPSDIDRAEAQPGDVTDGKPLVVLLNGGSASASEVVAGRCKIISGRRSSGRGPSGKARFRP